MSLKGFKNANNSVVPYGIGGGVAIPHCKAPGLDRVVCCFGRSVKGIDFESVDGKPAHLFFLLVAPEDAAGTHLEALKTISMLCHQPAFIERSEWRLTMPKAFSKS